MKRYSVFFVVSVFVAFFSFLINPISADAQQSASLSKDEARLTLKEIMPDVEVISVEKAAITGLWEVAVKSRGKKGIVYLDSSRNKVIFGSIVDIATKRNITKEKFDEINKVDVSRIPLDDALVLGDAKAKNKVIVFDDPD